MRVVVRGAVTSDGAIEPDVITILALADDPADKVAEKAVSIILLKRQKRFVENPMPATRVMFFPMPGYTRQSNPFVSP